MKQYKKILFIIISTILFLPAWAINYTSGIINITSSMSNQLRVYYSGIVNISGATTVISYNVFPVLYVFSGGTVNLLNGATLESTLVTSNSSVFRVINGALNATDSFIYPKSIITNSTGQLELSNSTAVFNNTTVSNTLAGSAQNLIRLLSGTDMTVTASTIEATSNAFRVESNSKLDLEGTNVRAFSSTDYAVSVADSELIIRNNSHIQGQVYIQDGVSTVLSNSTFDGDTGSLHLPVGITVNTITATQVKTRTPNIHLLTIQNFHTGILFQGQHITALLENLTINVDDAGIVFDNNVIKANMTGTNTITAGSEGIVVTENAQQTIINMTETNIITAPNPIAVFGGTTMKITGATINVLGALGGGHTDGKGVGIYSYNSASRISVLNNVTIHLSANDEVGILNAIGTVYIGQNNQSVNSITRDSGVLPKAAVWIGAHPNYNVLGSSAPLAYVYGTLQMNGMQFVVDRGGRVYFGNSSGMVTRIVGDVDLDTNATYLIVYTGGSILNYNYAANDPSQSQATAGSIIEGNLTNSKIIYVYGSNNNSNPLPHGSLFLITGDMTNKTNARIYFRDYKNYVNMVVGGNFSADNLRIDFDINPDTSSSDYLWIGGNFTGTYYFNLHFVSLNKLINPVRLFHVNGTLEHEADIRFYQEGPFELLNVHFSQDTVFYDENDHTKTYTLQAKDHYLVAVQSNADDDFCINVGGDTYCSTIKTQDVPELKEAMDKDKAMNDGGDMVESPNGYYFNKSYYAPIKNNNDILVSVYNRFLIADHTDQFFNQKQFVSAGISKGTIKQYNQLSLYHADMLYAFPSFSNFWLGTSSKPFIYGSLAETGGDEVYGRTYLYLLGIDVNKVFSPNMLFHSQIFFGRTNSSVNLLAQNDSEVTNWHAMDRDLIGVTTALHWKNALTKNVQYHYGGDIAYTYLFDTKVNDSSLLADVDQTIKVKAVHFVKPSVMGEITYDLQNKFEVYGHVNMGYFISSAPGFEVVGFQYHETDDAFNSITFSLQTGIRYYKVLDLQVYLHDMPELGETIIGVNTSIVIP